MQTAESIQSGVEVGDAVAQECRTLPIEYLGGCGSARRRH